jgi:hypothetical protein
MFSVSARLNVSTSLAIPSKPGIKTVAFKDATSLHFAICCTLARENLYTFHYTEHDMLKQKRKLTKQRSLYKIGRISVRNV